MSAMSSRWRMHGAGAPKPRMRLPDSGNGRQRPNRVRSAEVPDNIKRPPLTRYRAAAVSADTTLADSQLGFR